jgi:hypothetical protein
MYLLRKLSAAVNNTKNFTDDNPINQEAETSNVINTISPEVTNTLTGGD